MHDAAPFQRLLIFLLLGLGGCLPSSCGREEDRTLTASDSLSRQIALDTPEDTLAVVWSHTDAEIDSLAYPRTVLFAPDGKLWVSDVQHNRVFALDGAGRVVQQARGRFNAPYLAGFIGDTLAVFNPPDERFGLFVDGRAVRDVAVPDLPGDKALLRYGAVWGDGLAFKGTGEHTAPFLVTLDTRGRPAHRAALPGPYWRHAGLLFARGDTLTSLNFYRPVVDRFTRMPGDSLGRDTLVLRGFDSPTLSRSRLFLTGEVSEPPLLSTAAAAADSLLFVLNMRPGWVQVDAYGRSGRLVRRLIQPHPQGQRDFIPIHLDARARAGGYDLAVAQTRPRGRITLYRWTP